MRRLASDRGVSLDRIAGTGPLGRVTVADVGRAATTAESPSAAVAIESRKLRTSVAEVEVTRLARTTDLLASVVESAVQALRAVSGAATAASRPVLRVHAPDGPHREVVNAHDLSVSGLRRTLDDASAVPAHEGEPSGATLAVHDLRGTGLLFDLPVLAGGELVALSVGDAVDRPAVVALPDGGRGIGMGTFVHLALTVDEHAAGTDAAVLLTQVRQRLEAHDRRAS
nr:E3 binding domain-containing protein [Terracoccus sp. 273MFTsu3.1]